jgi:hypothetical protein
VNPKSVHSKSSADRFERKWIICGAAVAISVFGMAFSQFTQAPLLILCGVAITASNMTMSYAYHAYQTEVFPTAIRARASGLFYSMSRVADLFRLHRRLCAARGRRRRCVRLDHGSDGDRDHRDRGFRSERARPVAGCLTVAVAVLFDIRSVAAPEPDIGRCGSFRLKPAELFQCFEQRGIILRFLEDMGCTGVPADLPP